VLAGGSGLLIEHNDAAAIERALRAVFTDQALLERLSSAARRQASSFSWETVAGDYERLARAVVARSVEVLV
jgi:glycosyltransferase involved in cell wall biosynthesis